MLTGLMVMCLGTAWAADPLKNDWSGEYPSPGNITLTVSPLRLAGQDPLARGYPGASEPMLDMTVEFRTGGSRSFALTAATSLSRAKGIAENLDIPDVPGIPDLGGGNRDYGDIGNIGGSRRQQGTPDVTGGGGSRGGALTGMEVGLQLRDYIIGGFDNGLFVGGHVGFTNPDFRNFRADHTSFGPMAGLKVTLSIFTVEAHGGATIGVGKQGFSVAPKVDFATGFTF
ncbi:MAG: hypothetical protein Q8P41_06760 [Pseudomonadota bacterium]|nr:hypothetical protein [Pseudomonadota bacterium]